MVKQNIACPGTWSVCWGGGGGRRGTHANVGFLIAKEYYGLCCMVLDNTRSPGTGILYLLGSTGTERYDCHCRNCSWRQLVGARWRQGMKADETVSRTARLLERGPRHFQSKHAFSSRKLSFQHLSPASTQVGPGTACFHLYSSSRIFHLYSGHSLEMAPRIM